MEHIAAAEWQLRALAGTGGAGGATSRAGFPLPLRQRPRESSVARSQPRPSRTSRTHSIVEWSEEGLEPGPFLEREPSRKKTASTTSTGPGRGGGNADGY